jgi:serine protease AprX
MRGSIVAVVALTALTSTAVPAMAAPSTNSRVYLIGFAPGELGEVTRAIRAAGGSQSRELTNLDTVVATLTEAGATSVRGAAGVRSVVPDSQVQLSSTSYDASADSNSMFNTTYVVGARDPWTRYTGQGIDIALLDSGVAPVAGLDAPGKVIHGPDLSFDSQNPKLRRIDTYGHGTHMAGIIAGRDASWTRGAASEDGTSFAGVAPGARIISVKLADASGATDVSQVLAGIDWVVQHAHDPGINIRVVNVSFGATSSQSYLIDPVAHAAEVAWRKGLVVVAAAGNSGTEAGRLANPAQDPYVIAVGAVDANGTRDAGDDTVPSYTARGDGVRNPDVVAPGAHIQSLRVPGSLVDERYGDGPGSINQRFLRGSGTSQAAAVVSGAAALLLEQRPSLTPDQVKGLLKTTARSVPSTDPQAVGSGLVNIKKAQVAATPDAVQQWPMSTGNGPLEAARGGQHLVLNNVALNGERDIFGVPFDSTAHALAAETASAWQKGTWNGRAWSGATWSDSTWADTVWMSPTWAGVPWTGDGWGDGTWTGQTWVGQTWVGQTWFGQTWLGQTWVGQTWATGAWS